jgi:arginase
LPQRCNRASCRKSNLAYVMKCGERAMPSGQAGRSLDDTVVLQRPRDIARWLVSADTERASVVIGAASGLGAPDASCCEGPAALLASGILTRLWDRDVPLSWPAMLYPRRGLRQSLHETIGELCRRIAREVEHALAGGDFPIVVGGDHSCAVGTWTGVARAHGAQGPLGLVWIDAHMDSHTPATSHSGMLHGMPLASLLGQDTAGQLASPAMVAPEHVCLVGVRSYESEEAQLLSRLGVRVFATDEVRERGLDAVIDEAISIARVDTAAYGISLDLDALDPTDAPGVGSPAADGLRAADLLRSLRRHAADPRLAALEIAEFNPRRDIGGRTLALIEEVIATIVAPARIAATC